MRVCGALQARRSVPIVKHAPRLAPRSAHARPPALRTRVTAALLCRRLVMTSPLPFARALRLLLLLLLLLLHGGLARCRGRLNALPLGWRSACGGSAAAAAARRSRAACTCGCRRPAGLGAKGLPLGGGALTAVPLHAAHAARLLALPLQVRKVPPRGHVDVLWEARQNERLGSQSARPCMFDGNAPRAWRQQAPNSAPRTRRASTKPWPTSLSLSSVARGVTALAIIMAKLSMIGNTWGG